MKFELMFWCWHHLANRGHNLSKEKDERFLFTKLLLNRSFLMIWRSSHTLAIACSVRWSWQNSESLLFTLDLRLHFVSGRLFWEQFGQSTNSLQTAESQYRTWMGKKSQWLHLIHLRFRYCSTGTLFFHCQLLSSNRWQYIIDRMYADIPIS